MLISSYLLNHVYVAHGRRHFLELCGFFLSFPPWVTSTTVNGLSVIVEEQPTPSQSLASSHSFPQEHHQDQLVSGISKAEEISARLQPQDSVLHYLLMSSPHLLVIDLHLQEYYKLQEYRVKCVLSSCDYSPRHGQRSLPSIHNFSPINYVQQVHLHCCILHNLFSCHNFFSF